MGAFTVSLRRLRRAGLVVPFALAVSGAALAATMGGAYLPAHGEARISTSGLEGGPVEIVANLRFEFDGAPADRSGTGTIHAYDPSGQALVGEFPFAWETGRGSSFKVDINNPAFAAFVAARIEEASGQTATVALEHAGGKGAVKKNGMSMPVSLKATGGVDLDGVGPYPLKVRLKLK